MRPKGEEPSGPTAVAKGSGIIEVEGPPEKPPEKS
jgi:hypothetical protein